jgi:cytoskeletal protein RodZ
VEKITEWSCDSSRTILMAMDQEPQEPLGPPELPKGTKFTPLTTVQPKLQPESDPLEEDHLNEHVEYPGDPDGLIAAEEHQKWQAKHSVPVEQLPKARKKRSKGRWLVAPLVLILIGAAAYGAYWFGNKQADKKTGKSAQTTQHTSNQQPQQTTPKQETTIPTKHYDSATYTLGFDYPQTWTVTDTTAKLTVASPTVSMKTADGSTSNGHVVLTIQNQQTTIAGYPAGGADAVLESQKLTYKQPTPVQRAQTYLTYLSYGTKAGGLNALYVTGDNGYQKDQTVPLTDVVKGNPLISVTFQSCTSADCSTGTPTTLVLPASSWSATAENKQVISLLESIQLN